MLGGMAQPDPWLEHYGERRNTPRTLPPAARRARADRRSPQSSSRRSPCTPRRHRRMAASERSRRLSRAAPTARPGERALRDRRAVSTSRSSPPHASRPAVRSFYLEGGPGGAATDAAVSVNEVFAKVSEFRDIVLVDQRGTGGSQSVACPQEHVRATDADAVASYLRRCFARLGSGARRLSTEAAAADLERVRRALGYGRVDLYGSSYGATLAQIYLRRFPRSVRTATLDGASLTSVPVYELAAATPSAPCEAQIARCRAQPACRAGVPRHARRAAACWRGASAHAPTTSRRRSPCCCARPRTPRACRCSCTRPPTADAAPLVARVRRARGHGARRALAPAHVLGHDLQRALGSLRCRRDRSCEPRELPGARRRRPRASLPPGLRGRARRTEARRGARGPGRRACRSSCWPGDDDPQDPPANLAGWRADVPATAG